MRRFLTATAMALLLASPALAAKPGVTIGMQLEPPNLDPTGGAAQAIDSVVYGNIYEGLTRIDRTGAAQPALAQSWEISDDGLVYTFHLAAGVKFHDGADMDASDVQFSFARAVAEDSKNAQKALFEPIETIEVVDPSTVRITLKRPTGNFLWSMGWGDAVIVDPASIDNAATDPVGTGPYKFSKWNKGDSVELVRNPDYWGAAPSIETATFKFISDPTAALAALMAGDIDAFPGYPSPETLPQLEADPRYVVTLGSTEGETILSTNNKADKFSDVRVRRAVAHAIDRQAIIDGAMFGQGTPIGSHFAPHHPAYVDLTGLSAYDPELSKKLLAEAGYPDGFEGSLKLPPPAYARRGGEIIAAQLREVGINLTIENLEWAQWLEQVFKGKDFDLTIVSHTEPMDIGIYARPEYYFQYDNPAFQKLMEDLNAATDPTKQAAIMGAAQAMIAEDAVNGYLFQLALAGVWSADLQGYWVNAPTAATMLSEMSWAN
jgi:peptide/nickel transport system substrate-binding protein